jgi:hypothetical protein
MVLVTPMLASAMTVAQTPPRGAYIFDCIL